MSRTFAEAAAARDAEWVVLATIEGCGTSDGTLHKFCSTVPAYAAADTSYRAWLTEWPDASAERVDVLGGFPTAGELTLTILDVDDTLTSEWRTESRPIGYLASAAAADDGSITMIDTSAVVDPSVLYIGNEALTVDSIGGGGSVTVGRGKLDTDASAHPAGAPVYAYLPYLHSRRVRLYVVHSDAASSAQEHEIGAYRIDYRGLTEDLNAYVVRATSQLRWFGRLAGRRPREAYELLSWRTSDWQGRPISQPSGDWGGVNAASQRSLFKNLDTGELFSSPSYQGIVAYRGLYDSPIAEPSAGNTIVRVFGADPNDDPDYPTTWFRWSPSTPSAVRWTGTWNKSANWIDIILNLIVSSADPADGRELNNRNTSFGAWDCLPVGLGIGAPQAQVDWQSALDVRSRTPDYLFPNFYIGEASIPFGELVTQSFLRPVGAYFSTVGGTAKIVLPRMPLAGASAISIGSSEILSRPVARGVFAHDIGCSQDMTGVVASLVYKVGPRGDKIVLNASDFGAVYGQGGYYAQDARAAEIDATSARTTAGGRCAFLESRAMGRLLRMWRPPWTLSPSVGSEQYARGVGTQVELTHEQLPDPATGTRGVSAMPAEVTQVGFEISPDRGYVHRWEAQSYGTTMRAGRIPPAARVVSMATDGPNYAVTVTANRFTSTDAQDGLPTSDAAAFSVDDVVELRDRAGLDVGGMAQKVVTVGANKLTLDGDFGGVLTVGTGNAGQVLRYANADDADTQQTEAYVFWADQTNRSVGATADAPWRYGEP